MGAISLITPYLVILLLNVFGGAIATLGVGLALPSLSLNLIGIFCAIIVGTIISDSAYYFIGRFASDTLRSKFMGRGKKKAGRFAMVEQYFNEHGASTIFLGKMSDVLAVPAVVLAGATKMAFSRFLLISIPTSMLKTVIILAAGYLLSRSTDTSNAHFVVYGIGGVFLIALVVFVSRQFYKMVKINAKALKR